ncbi:hypothetical protein BJ508DRAFT_336727 [Ascobolus immersus RN42]|uniref:Endonuclease/exonuclease/phosphatase domain-containing protein n=1 Tax=Ascobolus immersus RN42 TaxID=1160509 RepID=A0A3N4H7K6_ASCIM|nr:hypothetical protein BJ508DRAFT_336727 [Ascobolus immersus RN42]
MQGILKTATETADLVLLQEPFLSSDYSFTVSSTSFDMQLSGGSSPTRRPRLAVFTSTCHPSLKVTLRHDLTTDPDAQALEIQAHGIPSLILYHVYNQQVNGDGVFTIERMFTRASVLPKRCILAGDFNAHHLWWNSNTTQERNAETLNNPSVLDLTFASPDVFDAIFGWSQDKQAGTGSDHAVIRFQLDTPQDLDLPIPSPPRYNWKKADWEAFTQELQAASLPHQDDWNHCVLEGHRFKSWSTLGRCQMTQCSLPRWEDRVEKAASSVSIIVKSEEMAKRCMQKCLNIDMQKLEVVRFVRNRQDQQCSTCQKFGHHYLRCTAKQPACRLCGASHKTVDHKCDKCNTKGKRCEHLTPYCANCQTTGHTASDNACNYRKTILAPARPAAPKPPVAPTTPVEITNTTINNASSSNPAPQAPNTTEDATMDEAMEETY